VGCAGDNAVEELIQQGIMKQWMQGGVLFASYRTIEVSRKEETRNEKGFEKAVHCCSTVASHTLQRIYERYF
jgi:hypothetical protein